MSSPREMHRLAVWGHGGVVGHGMGKYTEMSDMLRRKYTKTLMSTQRRATYSFSSNTPSS